MPLDLSKLQKVVHLPDGSTLARCPACAASGNDAKGDHLRLFPDGRFGCCVHPGDRPHRRQIYALARPSARPGVISIQLHPKPPPPPLPKLVQIPAAVRASFDQILPSSARPNPPPDPNAP